MMTFASEIIGQTSGKHFQFVASHLFPMLQVGWQQVRQQQQQIVRQQQHSQTHLQQDSKGQSVANESLHWYSQEYCKFLSYLSNFFIFCRNCARRVIRREVEADRGTLVALVRERQSKHHIEIVNIA